MNLYDKLKDKTAFEKAGKLQPETYAKCVDELKVVNYPTELKVGTAADIFWTLYPMKVIDLTTIFKMFN